MIEKQERCLNYNTPLQGKFCHACGQKQIEPSERIEIHSSSVLRVSFFARKELRE